MASNVYRIMMVGLALGGGLIGWWFFSGRYAASSARPVVVSVGALTESLGVVSDRLIPVAIIGSGPAGLSAGLYTARFNIHTVIFEGKKPGGQLMSTSDVENWPGINRELGMRIIDRLRAQALQFGAQVSAASVEALDCASWPYLLTLDDGSQVYALTIILATGATPRGLDVPGEAKYWGKGVTSCAVCDAPFFKDRTVVVVGGGDAAVEQALQLASHARSITMLVRGKAMRASHAMQQRLGSYQKITIRYGTKVKEILGDGNRVTGVTLLTESGEEQYSTDGVFLAIGHIPNTELAKPWISCDEHGYIVVAPHRQHTSQPGVFAAGDVADHYYRQAGIASGDGIKAAIDAASYLREQGMDDAVLGSFASHFFNPIREQDLPPILDIDTLARFQEALKNHPLLLVDFYTPQCPSCKQLVPHLAALAKTYGEAIAVVKVDGTNLPELMERYEIHAVPTLLVFKDGIVVGRSTSIGSRRDLQGFMGQFIH